MGPVEALSGEGAVRFAAAFARRPAKVSESGHVRSAAVVRRRWIPSAPVAGLAIAILAVLALTLQHLRLERDLAVSAGAREVGMRATLIAERLNAALSADPHAS